MKDADYKGIDKLYHFLVCAAGAVFETEAAVAAAVAKEYGDSRAAGGHWCWWDILADTLGIIVGTSVRLLISGGKWHWY